MSTITSAYMQLLEDDTASGVGLECSVDKIIPFPDPPFANGKFSKRAVSVYDPLFKLFHGENCGLPDVVTEETF
jgi:hypothetical protein